MKGDREFPAGIHRKLVNNGLSEYTMVTICSYSRMNPSISSSLAEIVIGEACSWTKNQGDGNHEQVHEDIEDVDVDIFQQTDEYSVHPGISVCRSFLSFAAIHEFLDIF